MSEDLAFWLSYLSNGKHLTWYASFQFTIFAAIAGGTLAVIFGLLGAALKNSRFLPLRLVGSFYSSIVRGVPDVLFFLFFPLAFEQAVEWFMATQICTPEAIAVLFELAGEVNRTKSAETAGLLKALAASLGILQGDPRAFLQAGSTLDDATIQARIDARAMEPIAPSVPVAAE